MEVTRGIYWKMVLPFTIGLMIFLAVCAAIINFLDPYKILVAIGNWIQTTCASWGLPGIVPDAIIGFSIGAIVLAVVSVLVMFLTWMERKVIGHMQIRLGPMRTGGWHGWAQPIADGVKLLSKEDTIPDKADQFLFRFAPLLFFTGALLPFVVIPIGKFFQVTDLNIGVLYIFAVTTFGAIGILLAGWSSNNKYSLIGGIRSVAQIVSYEVPMVLSVIGVIMIAQTLSMQGLISGQTKIWYILYQPLGFIIFLICAVAETNRSPFDIAEAENEIVAGFHTEYSGMKFALFFLAEYTNMFTVSAVATTLFFGGWKLWGLEAYVTPILVFILKTMFFLFLMMWFRATFPRLRVDQLMRFAWKVLVPLALLNILITGIVILLIQK